MNIPQSLITGINFIGVTVAVSNSAICSIMLTASVFESSASCTSCAPATSPRILPSKNVTNLQTFPCLPGRNQHTRTCRIIQKTQLFGNGGVPCNRIVIFSSLPNKEKNSCRYTNLHTSSSTTRKILDLQYFCSNWNVASTSTALLSGAGSPVS